MTTADEIITFEEFSDYKSANLFTPYRCTAGHWTVGRGIKVADKSVPKESISLWEYDKASEAALFSFITKKTYRAVDGLIEPFVRSDCWVEAPDRMYTMYSMAYQLGIGGLRGFKNMLAAFNEEKWEEAARQCLDSKAYAQAPNRFARNAHAILTGEYDFNIKKDWAEEFIG